MKFSVVGTLLNICVAVYLSLLVLVFIGEIEYTKGMDQALSYTQAFLDKVADTKILTEDMIADFNLEIASCSVGLDARISRETKVINPDPLNPGKTYATYCLTDDIYNWEQGDVITVEVRGVGTSVYEVLAEFMSFITIPSKDFTLARSVR